MKYCLACLNVLVVCVNLSIAGDKEKQLSAPFMVPIIVEGKWGYCDTNLRMVISAQYDVALPYENGMAIVAISRIDSSLYFKRTLYGSVIDSFYLQYNTLKYGIINEKGVLVLPMHYDRIVMEENRFFLYKQSLHWHAYSNYNPEHNEVEDNYAGTTVVDSTRVLDHQLKPLLPSIHGRMAWLGDEMYLQEIGIMGKNDMLKSTFYLHNGIDTVCHLPTEILSRFSGGKAVTKSEEGRVGLLDKMGKAVMLPGNREYYYISAAKNHKAAFFASDSCFIINDSSVTLEAFSTTPSTGKAFHHGIEVVKKFASLFTRDPGWYFRPYIEYKNRRIELCPLNGKMNCIENWNGKRPRKGYIRIDRPDELIADENDIFIHDCGLIFDNDVTDYMNGLFKNGLTLVCTDDLTYYVDANGKNYLLK